jgi:hypothetical protein
MIASLTASRLSLSSSTLTNLTKLITRLENAVSEIPPETKPFNGVEEKDTSAEGGESDEDPTEMFHRDIGVQTSFSSKPPSRSSSPTRHSPENTDIATEQVDRLSNLKRSLEGLVEDSMSEGYDQQELDASIGVLRDYCDSLAYVAPPVYNYGVGGYSAAKDDKKDEISRFKAGIIGVKGVLLSVKSFPGGYSAGSR